MTSKARTERPAAARPRARKAVPGAATIPPDGAMPVEDDLSDVSVNLDTAEREGKRPKPFTFGIAGRRFSLPAADDLPWQDLVEALRSPLSFFLKAMGPKDAADFLDMRFPQWKMNYLIKEYMTHYGMGSPGEQTASSTS